MSIVGKVLFQKTVDSEIKLEVIQESVADDLFQLIDRNREYLSKWLAWPALTHTVEDLKIFIKNAIIQYLEGKSLICTIKYQDTVVGVVGFNEIDHSLKKVELGYWLAKNYQGNGIITKSCQLLIDYAFSHLAIEKIQISVASDNAASRKICSNLGLELEGIIKNSENLHNTIVAHAIYAKFNIK